MKKMLEGWKILYYEERIRHIDEQEAGDLLINAMIFLVSFFVCFAFLLFSLDEGLESLLKWVYIYLAIWCLFASLHFFFAKIFFKMGVLTSFEFRLISISRMVVFCVGIPLFCVVGWIDKSVNGQFRRNEKDNTDFVALSIISLLYFVCSHTLFFGVLLNNPKINEQIVELILKVVQTIIRAKTWKISETAFVYFYLVMLFFAWSKIVSLVGSWLISKKRSPISLKTEQESEYEEQREMKKKYMKAFIKELELGLLCALFLFAVFFEDAHLGSGLENSRSETINVLSSVTIVMLFFDKRKQWREDVLQFQGSGINHEVGEKRGDK